MSFNSGGIKDMAFVQSAIRRSLAPSTSLFFSFLSLLCLTLATTSGCSREGDADTHAGSDVETTGSFNAGSIRNGGAGGFCWAYALTDMIESRHRLKTGKTVRLSPESIGFWRMVRGLTNIVDVAKSPAKRYRAADVAKLVEYSGADAFFVGQGALIMGTVGIVPESVWKAKINTNADYDALFKSLAKRFAVLWEEKIKQAGGWDFNITDEEIISRVMVGEVFKSAPPKPNEEFNYDGEKFTPRTFLTSFLDFKYTDYDEVFEVNKGRLEKLIHGIKTAVASGQSVPISFPLDSTNSPNRDVFRGFSAPFKVTGGHTLVVTDFINKNGGEHRMPPEVVQQEVKKSFAELDYLKLKNNHGRNGPFFGFAALYQSYLLKAPYISVYLPRELIPAGSTSFSKFLEGP